MELHILGPVELWGNGEQLSFKSDKERILLAVLTLNLGRPVAIRTLIDHLWDGAAPLRARENVHTYVSRVRKRLRSACANEETTEITRHAHTYTLVAAPESVDWGRFQRLVEQAGAAEIRGDDEGAISLLDRAEALWQGEPLAGLPGAWAETVRRELTERRLSATVSRVSIRLRLGSFADLVGELSSLVEQHPGDESLACQLMLVYYGTERFVEAVRVHQKTRRFLIEEFGSVPGAEMERIHRGILNRVAFEDLVDGYSSWQGDGMASPSGAEQAMPPGNLPHQAPIIGRRAELEALDRAVEGPAGNGSLIALETVSGMAGVGKTAIAVHIARKLAARFPDGQLFLDLRTHSPARQPHTADTALTALLRMVVASPKALPVSFEGRITLWRTTLAERRSIIVLDDVADSAQVAALLPDSPGCLVIVTSRRHLTGLPHAQHVLMDILPAADAITLFRRFAGAERTRSTEETARVVRLCGYLPLAIELVANRFRVRPSWSLATLGDRLALSPQRLSEIRDPERDMARAFELSYQSLTRAQRTAFRRLGLHPGPGITADAAAALLGQSRQVTERLIESLLSFHLLREPTPDRYAFHDLLGEYARVLAESEESERDRLQTLERLADYYTQAVERADRLVYPHRLREPIPLGEDRDVHCWPDVEAVRSWLAAEQSTVMAVEKQARRHGLHEAAARLAAAISGYLEGESHWQDAKVVLEPAVAHWTRTGKGAPLSRALLTLSAVHASTGHYVEAMETSGRALELGRAAADLEVEAEALGTLGVVKWHLGENRAAVTLHREALALRATLHDTWGMARCSNNIAISLLALGQQDEALEFFKRALAGFGQTQDRARSVVAQNNMADVHALRGELEESKKILRGLLVMAESSGSPYELATLRTNLGRVLVDSGDVVEAFPLHHRSLQSFRILGDKKGQATALNGLGEAYRLCAGYDKAVLHHRHALAISEEIGASQELVRAHRGLGGALLATGPVSEAAEHLEVALAEAVRIADPREQALAQAALAEARLASGHPAEARILLEQARNVMLTLNVRESRKIENRLSVVVRTLAEPR